MVRSNTIDCLKGGLILLVIIGHISLGTLDESYLRFVIYSFHMPVFVFVSGYLANVKRLTDMTFSMLMEKYWNRLLLPWILAWITYSLCISYSRFSFIVFLKNLSTPFYHLWYVPSIFVFIVSVWALCRIRCKCLLFLILTAVGLLLHQFIYSDIIGVRCSYFIYFVMGLMASSFSFSRNLHIIGGGVFLLFIAFVFSLKLFGVGFDDYRVIFELPLMIVLCFLSVNSILNMNNLNNRAICFVGRNSLVFYLWHVFPILLLKRMELPPIAYVSQ